MKKLLIAAASLAALDALPAQAGDVHIGFYTAPPVVYRPAPVAYVAPMYVAPRPVYYKHKHFARHYPHYRGGYNVAYVDGPYRGWR